MEHTTIGLIGAMPDEIRPFLRQVGPYKKSVLDGFPLYRFSVGPKPCLLIESGIGVRRVERASETLIASLRPDLLILFGFGGAVQPGMIAGDLAIARRSLFYQNMSTGAGEAIVLSTSLQIRRTLELICEKKGCKVTLGDFITADGILNKKELSETLPPDIINPVLDMETWAVARSAGRNRISLLAIRAISDAADEELDFSLDQFTDHEMNIRVSKILRTIAQKPRIVPQLLRLAGNSRIAGRNLAAAVKGILESDIALDARETT